MKATTIAMSALGWLASLFPNSLPAAAPELSTLLANADAVNRRRELAPYIKSLRPEEIPATLNQAIAGHGAGRDEVIDALSGRWVEFDAPAALAFSRQTADRQAKACLGSAYYDACAKRDTGGALNAARQAVAGERATAIWAIAHRIGGRDPKQAHELIRSVHASKMQDLNYFIFWNWAEKNLPEATQTLLQEAKTAGYAYPCQVEVWAITDRLFDDNPKAAAGWVAQLPPGKVRDQAFERIVSEWKKVDRESLVPWLNAWPDPDQARNPLLNLSQAPPERVPPPAKADPAFAQKARQLDEILAESNFWLELKTLLPFVDGLTSAEFRPALEHLRNIPESSRNTVIDMLVARWWEVDPAGAIEAIPVAGTIHDGEFSDRFLADVYAAWSQRDPEAAFAASTRDLQGAGNFRVLWVTFAALARQNPAQAHAAFQKLNDANSHLLVTPIFTEWAATDLPGATKALAKETHSDGAIEGTVIGLMRKGPAAAIAWAEQLPDESLRNRARRNIALRWPDDPKAAMAWLEQSPDFEGKDRAFGHVAVNWAIRNPAESLHHAIGLSPGKEKNELIFWGMAQMTYDDAEAAQRFVRKLPADGTRTHALTTLLIYWSEYDPTAAADFLASIKAEATPGDLAIIASTLADGNPVSAVQWLDAFPAALDKTQAIAKIAEKWERSDPFSAESWVRQLPAGQLYDAGARGICLSQEDSAQALKWARSIQEPDVRTFAVKQAFEAATSWRHAGFGDFQKLKDEINGAPELTEADKNAFVARMPVITFSREPQFPKEQQAPAER